MKRLISLFLFSSFVSCYSVEVTDDFPKVTNCVSLDAENFLFKRYLDGIIEIYKNENSSQGDAMRIESVTPNEAKAYFSGYVLEQLGEDRFNQVSDNLFSQKHFGKLRDKDDKEKTVEEKIGSFREYVTSPIFNSKRGSEIAFDEVVHKWSLDICLLTPEEAYVYVATNQRRYISDKFPIKNFLKYKEENKEEAEKIFLSKFGVPEEEQKRKEHFLNHPIGFFNSELVHSIYKGALNIMKYSSKGDTIVIFGNTPFFVGRALQHIISDNPLNENHRKIIYLPFSGSPNIRREGNFPDSRNFVTKERLSYFKQKLKDFGLSVENGDLKDHQTHFVDAVASGSGVSFVIEQILREAKEANLAYPSINIFCLNKIDVNSEDKRNSKIVLNSANDGEEVLFHFPSKEKLHFKVPGRVTYVENHGFLDNLPSEDWRAQIENNPSYWTTEYEHRLKKEPTKNMKILFDYFDTNIKELIEK